MSGSHRAASQRRSAPASGPARAAEPTRARGRRRKPKPRRARKLTFGTAMLIAAATSWFTIGPGRTTPGAVAATAPDRDIEVVPMQAADGAADARTVAPAADRSDRTSPGLAAIPGLGPSWMARVPADTRQLVVVSGRGKDSSDSTVTLWTKADDGSWQSGASWPAHNAYKGWTTDHTNGDLRSPIGIYGLTDAGGRKADPGSRLPYTQDTNFVMTGRGFDGEPLAGSFDYVVAINYNRVAGRSPLDPATPDGAAKGGGIWLHLDHGGPTHGCISLTEDHMIELVKTLDPAAHPMIVMGDTESLVV